MIARISNEELVARMAAALRKTELPDDEARLACERLREALGPERGAEAADELKRFFRERREAILVRRVMEE